MFSALRTHENSKGMVLGTLSCGCHPGWLSQKLIKVRRERARQVLQGPVTVTPFDQNLHHPLVYSSPQVSGPKPLGLGSKPPKTQPLWENKYPKTNIQSPTQASDSLRLSCFEGHLFKKLPNQPLKKRHASDAPGNPWGLPSHHTQINVEPDLAAFLGFAVPTFRHLPPRWRPRNPAESRALALYTGGGTLGKMSHQVASFWAPTVPVALPPMASTWILFLLGSERHQRGVKEGRPETGAKTS